MQLSQIPLGLQRPLGASTTGAGIIGSGIGVSRFQLGVTPPLLRLFLLRSHIPLAALPNRGMNFDLRGARSAPLKSKFIPKISNAPLATVEELMLGRQRGSRLLNLADKRLLGAWNLDPLAELEPTSFIESVPTEVSTSTLQTVSEITKPGLIELSTTEINSIESPQLKFIGLSPLQPQIAKPRRWTNLPKIKQAKLRETPSTKVEQFQPHNDIQFREQIEDSQLITEFLEQSERKENQPGYLPQIHLADGLNQQFENLQLERTEVSFEPYLEENLLGFHSQVDLTQPDIRQTQKQKGQRLEANLAEKIYAQKMPKKDGKQSGDLKKKSKLKTGKHVPFENQSLGSAIVEPEKKFTSADFTNDNFQELNPSFVNSNGIDQDDIGYGNAIPELVQPVTEQNEQSEMPTINLKSFTSETVAQPSTDVISADVISGDTASTNQTTELTPNHVPETASPETKQTESLIPPQGFSVGGQVTASAPAKSIDASDTIPAMLTPGEFVVNATDAQKHLPLLHHLNQGGSLAGASDQMQAAQVPQITESNSANHSTPPALSRLQRPSGLGIHQPLASSEKLLQSGVFDQPEFSQANSPYKSPNFIFRSQHASVLPASSTNSPSEWNSIEDLLQVTDTNAISYSSVDELAFNSDHPSISISNRPTSNRSMSNAPASTSISNSLQNETLQPTPEAVDQANTSSSQKTNDVKTLEAVMEILAQEIFARLNQHLAIERERQGVYAGRLPW
jgi:hypothetical protein